MSDTSLQDQIDDATLDFTLGDSQAAIQKLSALAATEPESFGIWHALTEIHFAEATTTPPCKPASVRSRWTPTISISTPVSLGYGWSGAIRTKLSTSAPKPAC